MKEIDIFINTVYSNLKGNRKEVKEMKEEMRSHLLEAVHDLKAEGKSEKEAIDMAIERFGGEKEARSIVLKLVNDQRIFSKWLLYSSLTILFITSLLFSIFITMGNKNISEQAEIAYQIGSEVASVEGLSPVREENFQTIVNKTNYISNVKVYKTAGLGSSGNLNNETPDYEYERDLSGFSNLILKTHYYGSEGSWVSVELADYRYLSFIILFIGFTSYWVLFLVWAIINAYHRRSLNAGWVIVFTVFNVPGYLIYRLATYKREKHLCTT